MTQTTPSFGVLPLGTVRPRGWLRAQLLRDLDQGFAGRLDALTPHARHDLFRDRISPSEDYLAWWDAETRGNWLWGYVMMAHLADAPAHRARAADLVRELLATRDDDGYLGIYGPGGRFRHAAGENAELWSQSRALLALAALYELTGEAAIEPAIRAAVDLTLEHYPHGTPYFQRGPLLGRDVITGLTHGLCYLDVLEWLYDRTHDRRYAEAGIRLYREFSAMPLPFPNDDFALPRLADPAPLLHGHAVHTAEHLRALLWVHAVAPAVAPAEIVGRALDRMRLYRLPSGALLGDEGIHGCPLPEAAYEFCTSTELAFSLSSALQKLGRADLGDWLETLVYNAVQGARLPDGSAIAYLSADTRLRATAERRDAHSPGAPGRRFKYSPTHDDVACCCNPNAVRVLPQFVARMWQRLDAPEEGLAAVAYGPCELSWRMAGVGVGIVEETGYPFDDDVELAIEPERPVEFTLLLRRPEWTGTMDVTATGTEPRLSGGWWRMRKIWAPGDRVRITFSWRVRAEAYANGEVAVLRGPLQYAWPVDHRLEPTRDYEIVGFHDYDVVPRDASEGYRAAVLDRAAPDLGLQFERSADVGDRPWDAAPAILRAGAATLVPLGCTVLRRAAFPAR